MYIPSLYAVLLARSLTVLVNHTVPYACKCMGMPIKQGTFWALALNFAKVNSYLVQPPISSTHPHCDCQSFCLLPKLTSIFSDLCFPHTPNLLFQSLKLLKVGHHLPSLCTITTLANQTSFLPEPSIHWSMHAVQQQQQGSQGHLDTVAAGLTSQVCVNEYVHIYMCVCVCVLQYVAAKTEWIFYGTPHPPSLVREQAEAANGNHCDLAMKQTFHFA